ncbi:hypothetical protein ACKWTF_007415 [Chironomus riparius]
MVLTKAVASVQRMTTRNLAVKLRHYEGKAGERDWRYFTWKGMKKNYAVLPLVFIMTGAVAGLAAFIGYASKTRVDVSFNRANPQICESMDMMNPEVNKVSEQIFYQ